MTGCTICTHRSSSAINAALLAGDSATKIAARYGVSRYAVGRHGRAHLVTGELVVAERSGERRLDDLDLRLQQLEAVLTGVIDEALRSGKVTTLIAAVRECRQTVESIGKVRGQLDERPQINILALPQFTEASQRILSALAPWPEARIAVADALVGSGHEAERGLRRGVAEGAVDGIGGRDEHARVFSAPVSRHPDVLTGIHASAHQGEGEGESKGPSDRGPQPVGKGRGPLPPPASGAGAGQGIGPVEGFEELSNIPEGLAGTVGLAGFGRLAHGAEGTP